MPEKLVRLSAVTSEPKPQQGQDHRSSGNFSTQDAPDNTKNLRWEISGDPKADKIIFNVKRDVSNADDPVEFKGLKNGSTTSVKSFRSLYIADPKNADGKFVVTVSAVL